MILRTTSYKLLLPSTRNVLQPTIQIRSMNRIDMGYLFSHGAVFCRLNPSFLTIALGKVTFRALRSFPLAILKVFSIDISTAKLANDPILPITISIAKKPIPVWKWSIVIALYEFCLSGSHYLTSWHLKSGSFKLARGTRAVGIEYVDDLIGRNGGVTTIKTARASQLVVVSAGAFGSPSILERSGIGAESVLNKNNVKQIVDLPGVGENYMGEATPVRSVAFDDLKARSQIII